ncbi:MAG TPA: hypothetical protein VFF07_14160 [Actinomycetota bacterium]|nr:hypothetical protein [Actinomycetota bacterium]
MRVLVKMQMPVEAGNAAVKDGSLPRTIEALMKEHNPEAAYFFPENGKRTALFVFDLADPSRVPVVAEPLFHNLNASVSITPVMNLEDLQAGLREVGSI